jgi:hypothetical protein
MNSPIQLVPTSIRSAGRGPRRPRECPAFRRPQVRELPLRLEPVEHDTFGGLVSGCAAPRLRAVLSTTTHR